MGRKIVTVPFYYTGHEGWMEAGTSIVAGSSVVLCDVERHTHNHLYVGDFDEKTSKNDIKKLLSDGMKKAHQEAQAFMVQEFGDDWRGRASYSFGALEYNEAETVAGDY